MSKALLDSLILKYTGEVQVAKANIDVLLNNPTGVADHPDMVGTLDDLVKKLNSAEEQLSALKKVKSDQEQFLQE
tara:strand:+ start:980 stop:1204 length:225 start_codon:yes stop_codon:yes gene_type:complete